MCTPGRGETPKGTREKGFQQCAINSILLEELGQHRPLEGLENQLERGEKQRGDEVDGWPTSTT